VVISNKGGLSHNGIKLLVDGEVTLQLSAKSVGLFEAFYNSLKPIKLIDYRIDIRKPGKLYPLHSAVDSIDPSQACTMTSDLCIGSLIQSLLARHWCECGADQAQHACS
jgi:hypothetical protein